MTWRTFIPALAFLAASPLCQSQEVQDSAPIQIVALPESFSLIKRYSYPTSEKAGPRIVPRLEKVEVVKTGTISKKLEYFSNGTTTETWKSDGMEFLRNSSLPDQILVTKPEAQATGQATPANGEFPELDWVTAAVTPNKKTRKDVPCLVYKSEDKTVWLKAKTRLPILFTAPALQVSYTFQSPPDQPLQLPEKFTEKLESVKKAWNGRKD